MPGLVPRSESRRALKLDDFYELTGDRMTIGRAESNDISLRTARTVSRLHAVLEHSGDGWSIRNHSDANPMLINGQEVECALLNPDDELVIGDVYLNYREHPKKDDSTVIEREVVPGRSSSPGGTPPTATVVDTRLERLTQFLERSTEFQTEEAVYKGLKEFLTEALRASRVMIVRAAGETLTGDDGTARDYAATVIHRVRDSGKAMLWTRSKSRDPSHSASGFGIHSVICTPIPGDGDSSGDSGAYIYLHRTEHQELGSDDLEFVCAVARVAFIVKDNLRMQVLLRHELNKLRDRDKGSLDLVIGGKVFQKVVDQARLAAMDNIPVLLRGETGTGKDVLARFVHQASDRAGGPFVAINCAAIPDTLLESELFGYAPHSGIANARPEGKAGSFELADGGTLFLDEIGDLPLDLQPTLLRILETNEVRRIGAEQPTPIDVRLIYSTHQDLEEMMARGTFREDLYFRMNAFGVDIPPLRERRGEIVALAKHFLKRIYQSRPPEERPAHLISPEAEEYLSKQAWAGNVRQLLWVIEVAALFAGGDTVQIEHLSKKLKSRGHAAQLRGPILSLEEVEARHIREVLQITNNNRKQAAEFLGIHRNTLTQKLQKMKPARDSENDGPPEDPGLLGI